MSWAHWKPSPLGRLLILAPLRIEARALRQGVRSAAVVRTGMGPKAATRMGERVVALADGGPVAVAGFCGGLRSEIRTGDVIVASELQGPGGVVSLPSAAAVAEVLRSAGLTVYVGPIVASDRVAFGARRARAAADGSIGVDMESYWLLEDHAHRAAQPEGQAARGPAALVRAVSDRVGGVLFGGMLPAGWLRAYRSLVRAGAALELWAEGLAPAFAIVGRYRPKSIGGSDDRTQRDVPERTGHALRYGVLLHTHIPYGARESGRRAQGSLGGERHVRRRARLTRELRHCLSSALRLH